MVNIMVVSADVKLIDYKHLKTYPNVDFNNNRSTLIPLTGVFN
jgi:hypothetical protein